MPRALVTGISGFAGGWLAEHLASEGDEVHGLVLPGDRAGLEARLGAALAPGGLHEGDLLDERSLDRALEAARPERVYHLAGYSSPRLSIDDPLPCWRANALGTVHLLDAIRRSGARPRTLVVGSAEVYGRAGAAGPIPETTPLRPLTPYGASKVAAEAAALVAFEAYGVPAIVARSFNHVGPRQAALFVAPSLARQVALAEAGLSAREVRVGNLDPVRDLTDVRDVARAYRLLAERGAPGEAYNVCSGRGVPVREVLETFLAAARAPLAVVEEPSLRRSVEIPRRVGDGAKLRAATGFAPRFGLAETLGQVLDEWRSRVRAATA
jgi:GDP-4-dehydro-6-deoxy-D-mannose reductase